jgi:hypothetical protein
MIYLVRRRLDFRCKVFILCWDGVITEGIERGEDCGDE